jgi:hypothetical protein
MRSMSESRILSTGRAFVSAIAESCTATVSDSEMINGMRDSGTIQDEFLAAQVMMSGS